MIKHSKLFSLLIPLAGVVLLTTLLVLTYRFPARRRAATAAERQNSARLERTMQRLGRAYSEVEDGRLATAEVILKEILQHEPHPMALRLLGRIYYESGRFPEAEEVFRKLIDRNMFDAPAHNNLGQVLFRRGQYPEALSELKKSLELNPESPMVHLNLSSVYAALNDQAAARRHFLEARKRLGGPVGDLDNNTGHSKR